jgi:pyridoxine 4-dehydrogenase
MLEWLQGEGITYIPYSPFGGAYRHREIVQHGLFKRLAAKHGCSPYAIILAWLLRQGPHVIPIPGASRPQSATDSAIADQVDLSADEVAEINNFQA